MSQEEKRESARLRKQAQRERQAKEKPPEPDTTVSTVEQAITEAEKAYVAEQLAQTREYASSFRAPEKKSAEALQARMERAEGYARWRFHAFLDGEVASL
jgi:hypothetical protein